MIWGSKIASLKVTGVPKEVKIGEEYLAAYLENRKMLWGFSCVSVRFVASPPTTMLGDYFHLSFHYRASLSRAQSAHPFGKISHIRSVHSLNHSSITHHGRTSDEYKIICGKFISFSHQSFWQKLLKMQRGFSIRTLAIHISWWDLIIEPEVNVCTSVAHSNCMPLYFKSQ